MSKLKTIPIPRDLLETSGLLVPADPELGTAAIRATNRQLRLFMAASMVGGNIVSGLDLYPEHLLNKPGAITQADIEREVWQLVDTHNEVQGG